VNYRGYDALLPFRHAVKNRLFPYTHNWRAVAALNQRLAELDVAKSIETHKKVSQFCREKVQQMGLELYAPEELR
jgi:aspartate aminotransferase-like enzyme